MKFDIDAFKGKYVMHCKDQKELNDFIIYLIEHGHRDKIPSHNSYCYYGENVYYFNTPPCWSDIEYAKRTGYTVLEWAMFTDDPMVRYCPVHNRKLFCATNCIECMKQMIATNEEAHTKMINRLRAEKDVLSEQVSTLTQQLNNIKRDMHIAIDKVCTQKGGKRNG